MKLFCFIDLLGPGGAQRQIVGLAILLKKKGYDVTVCTYYRDNFYKKLLDDSKIQTVVIQDAESPLRRVLEVYEYFKRERPDCVIAYLDTPSMIASVCRLLGCKYRLLVSDRNTTIKVRIRDRIKFRLMSFADYVIPNSYSQKDVMLKYANYLEKKIRVIPNFVDSAKFIYRGNHSLGVTPKIIVVASINQHKNTIGLLEAARKLKERGVRFKIIWYGITNPSDEYYLQCAEKIKSYRLEDYFQIGRKTLTIEKEYPKADYLCLPSFYEGTPNVICEAMSCGLPIICSNVCDNPLYVEEGVNGVLFDPYNVESIANAMEKILHITQEEYVKFSKESRRKSEALFSEDVFVNKYEKLLL